MSDNETSELKSSPEDACRMALAIARHGASVFPCLPDKRPACPHGFKDASQDPVEVEALWRRYPGPLVGIATGEVSKLWVIDVDSAKHEEASDWWQRNFHRIPPTRIYRTRSGGLHLYFRDGGATGNSAGKLATGVDVRGNGGYVIYWHGAGYPCLEPTPAAPWPAWVARKLAGRPAPALAQNAAQAPVAAGSEGVEGVLRTLARAQEGERNNVLHWCVHRLIERSVGRGSIEAMLLPICHSIGLPDHESRRTIESACRQSAAP